MRQKFTLKGIWTFTRLDKDGKIIDKETKKNTIVNLGLNLVRDFLGDVGVNAPKYIALGTDGTAVDPTDTSLNAEVDRQLATIDNGTDYEVTFSKTFTFGSSMTIKEAGLFDNAVASGSTMFNRVTTSKAVSTTVNLIVECTITISRV